MKLNYKRIILVGFAFFLIQAFWQAYDNTIPMILTNKFGMSQAWSGAIMALDNVLALFMLPLFYTIPYVWGGNGPTSFDCSGFVSWVLTNSGVCNTGKLGAQGLYNISTPVSSPQPGDLVFFVGTYDTPGVSHVGIYVGNSMMIHCGDPISYSNLNSSYWQAHFYAYARPPYN